MQASPFSTFCCWESSRESAQTENRPRDGRVVDVSSLENWHTCKAIESSNLSLRHSLPCFESQCAALASVTSLPSLGRVDLIFSNR